MGLTHLQYCCSRTNRSHHLYRIYWTTWELQPRAMQSGSTRPFLCPFFYCWSARPIHNPTTFLASWHSGARSERFVCAPVIHFFHFSFIEPFWGQSSSPSTQPNVVGFCPGIVGYPSPLTFTQISSAWLLDSPGIHVDSQTRPDGLSDVILTSGDGTMTLTLDPVCTYSLLYPASE
jgi:hypothetical protein